MSGDGANFWHSYAIFRGYAGVGQLKKRLINMGISRLWSTAFFGMNRKQNSDNGGNK